MAPPEAECIEDQMVQVKEVSPLLSGTVWPVPATAGSHALLASLAGQKLDGSRYLGNEVLQHAPALAFTAVAAPLT